MGEVGKILAIFGELKTWLLSGVGIITVVNVIKHGLVYQKGDENEKAGAMRNIKRTLEMGGGIFVAVAFATYVISKLGGK